MLLVEEYNEQDTQHTVLLGGAGGEVNLNLEPMAKTTAHFIFGGLHNNLDLWHLVDRSVPRIRFIKKTPQEISIY